MENVKCDVLIVGAGPAGLMAGTYAARAGAKTVIIEQLVAGGSVNLTPDIENFPGFKSISGADLGAKMAEQAESSGAEILYDEIVSVDLAGKSVICGENSVNYKSLIIAAGASPRKLGVPGEEEFVGAGVHYCALCDGTFYRDRDIVIVGGGNHAVEEAIYMEKIAKSVTLVNLTETFNAQSTLVERLGENVKQYHLHKVSRVLGEGKLVGMEIEPANGGDKVRIDCDGVFVAIGRVPNSQLFAKDLKLSKDGSIIVDAKMQASVEGVFAAGDIVEKAVRQVVTAVADGAVAAIGAVEFSKA